MKIALIIPIVLLGLSAHAQNSTMKPDDFAESLNKKLIVVTPGVNREIVKELSKKKNLKDNPNGVEEYKEKAEKYQKMFLKCFKEIWTLHSEYELLTETEWYDREITKEDAKQMIVLKFVSFGAIQSSSGGITVGYDSGGDDWQKEEDNETYGLYYHSFRPMKKTFFYLPDIDLDDLTEREMRLGLYYFQENIKHNAQANKKGTDLIRDLFEIQQKENCAMLQSLTLNIIDGQLDNKKNEKSTENYTHKLETISRDDWDKKLNGKTEGNAVILFFPYGATVGGNSINGGSWLFMKVVIDCSTLKVLSVSGTPSTGGYGSGRYIGPKDFKVFSDCN